MRRVKYEIDPKDNITGVKVMSLVDEPAMQSDFIAMSEEKDQYVELKAEGYKQVVAGMALIPDKDFLRSADDGETYVAYFSKDSVEAIRNKFHKEQMTSNVNVDHSQTDFIDAYLIESFIVDSQERLDDLKTKGIKEPVMGAWFVAYKIEDPETFKMVLDGKLKGFSVEIFIKKTFKAVKSEIQEVKESVERIEKMLTALKVEESLKDKSEYSRRLLQSKINSLNN